MSERRGRPDIVAVLAPVLESVRPEDHPLLLALLEQWAAERYRRWAAVVDDTAVADRLTDCAAREEEIATRVQSLWSGAPEVQAALIADHPDLRAITDSTFVELGLDAQFALQAEGERLGAATWRAFASAAQERRDITGAATFAACAELEDASAAVLDELLASQHSTD